MAGKSVTKALPAWMLPAAIAGGIIVLLFVGWKALTGGTEPVGPPIAVHAGQYDLRAELAKMRNAQKK